MKKINFLMLMVLIFCSEGISAQGAEEATPEQPSIEGRWCLKDHSKKEIANFDNFDLIFDIHGQNIEVEWTQQTGSEDTEVMLKYIFPGTYERSLSVFPGRRKRDPKITFDNVNVRFSDKVTVKVLDVIPKSTGWKDLLSDEDRMKEYKILVEEHMNQADNSDFKQKIDKLFRHFVVFWANSEFLNIHTHDVYLNFDRESNP